jgi:hypothetical protein
MLALSFLPALSIAQSPDLNGQKVIEELRGVRLTLEKVEKSLRVLNERVRIQTDENRLTALEAERQSLLTQEQSLREEIDKASLALRNEDPRPLPTLVQSAPGSEPVMRTEPSPARSRQAEATRRLQEVRQRIRTIEPSIASLRNRIAAAEKSLEDTALR